MDLEKFLNPPAIVQEKKKYTNFTLTLIGGEEEIKRWRLLQEAKEEAYKITLREKDQRLENYEKEIREKLATPLVKRATFKERLTDQQFKLISLKKEEEKAYKQKAYFELGELSSPPKKGFFKKIGEKIKSIWRSSNF